MFEVYTFKNSEVEYQILKEENRDKLAEYMLVNNKTKLIIISDEDGNGWNKSFLPDLKKFNFIDELLIYWTKIKDISGVHNCINLKTLWLDNDDKTKIDFSCFPKLEKFISWDRKGLKEIWSVKSLKSLTLAGLKQNSVQKGEALGSLEKLRILKSSVNDITFLNECDKITYLDLSSMSKLKDVDVIGNLENLSHLLLEANKVEDFSFVRKLMKLKYCAVESKIATASVKDFLHLKGIELLSIGGNEKLRILNRELDKLLGLNKFR